MGPRARRRLIGAGVVVVVVAAAAAAVVALTGSHSHAGDGSARFISANPHLKFGLTRKQVRRLTGPPTATRGSCWLFHPHHGMVGALSMGPPGTEAATSTGDLKLCFYANAFTSAYRHFFFRGRWKWVEWSPTLTIVSPPPPS